MDYAAERKAFRIRLRAWLNTADAAAICRERIKAATTAEGPYRAMAIEDATEFAESVFELECPAQRLERG